MIVWLFNGAKPHAFTIHFKFIIMKTKTFKIVIIIGKEWGTEKEFTRESVVIGDDDPNAYLKIDEFLNDLTTFYYSEKILEWVTSNSTLEKQLFWK